MAGGSGSGAGAAAGGAVGTGSAGTTPQNYFQLYRHASVGMALTDALDELIESGHISPQLARKVVEEFDKAASQTFSSTLRNKCSTKAKLQTYRLCDEVWSFLLKDAVFKLDGGDVVGPVSKVKIVAQKGNNT